MRWLHLRLAAPMASFGAPIIDTLGSILDFPTTSMITGLFANALGWTRDMPNEHQSLQSRLVLGSLWEEDGSLRRMTDYQTTAIHKDDRAWTTRGIPEKRVSSWKEAKNGWLTVEAQRDYHADLRMSVALRLEPEADNPTLDQLANALVRPARPLFIGRKCCLPSRPIHSQFLDADDVIGALRQCIPQTASPHTKHRAFWPATSAPPKLPAGMQIAVARDVVEQRNWTTRLHGGSRTICEAWIEPQGDSS